MVCADRISLQCPAGAARVNSEADHLRRFLILKDCIESSYCAVDHTTSTSNSLIVVVSRNLFLLLSLCFDSPCLGQLTMSSTFITPCSLRKWGSSVGGNISSPAAASVIGALEVTTVQMFYSRVYLAHRRISDPGLDMLRIAYGSLPAAPEP